MRISYIVFLTFLLLSCRGPSVAQLSSPREDQVLLQKILITGDSEACAMKYGAVKSVRTATEQVDIDCVGGTRVVFWSNGRMKQALEKDHYDAVIVFLGTNDYGMKPDPAPVLKQIEDAKVACVWAGPTLVRGQQSGTNAHLRSRMNGTCTYLDTIALGVPLADGVHPTGGGAVKWLRRAWELKNDAIKQRLENQSKQSEGVSP